MFYNLVSSTTSKFFRRLPKLYRGVMLFSVLGLGLLAPPVAFAETKAPTTWLNSTAILAKIPTAKATVGVIPYYTHDNQIYVLLGRERIDGNRLERAGKFSDFGGSVELDGTNLAQNAIRELEEETIGQIKLTPQDVLAKGILLQKLSSKGREISYIFYPMNEAEYKQTRELNRVWHTLCTRNIETPQCEKDQFTWVSLHDIANKSPQILDIDGNLHILQLREFFVQDCLEHPDFPHLVAHLESFNPTPARFAVK